MGTTIDNIVEASNYPISIIIVGIGSADFGKMDKLDSDDVLLRGSYGTAKRDIVQFVPYRDHKNNPTQLAASVLEEIPDQVVGFYKSIGRPPNPPPIYDPSKVQNQIDKGGITRTGTFKDQAYYEKSNFCIF